MKAAWQIRTIALMVLAPSGAWQGICLGIKEDGALLVQREDGKVEEVIAWERYL